MNFYLTLAILPAIVFASADSFPGQGQGGYSGGGNALFQSRGGSFGNGGGYPSASNNFGGFNQGYSGPQTSSSYGAPAPASKGFPNHLDSAFEDNQAPQVFKYVSVHAAPEDPDEQATKIVRVPGGKRKHVNIIFVKAPSNGADQKTELILPEAEEHKNLVYVLVKKSDAASNIKLRKPAKLAPSKPEVYFIQYKGGKVPAAATSTFSSPATPTSSKYGPPSPITSAPGFGPQGNSPSPTYGVA